MVVVEPRNWRIAAFFDVDRTLVRGSSIVALAGPLCRAGLLPKRALLGAAIRGLQFSTRGFDEEEVQQAVDRIGAAVRGMDAARLRRVADRAIPRVLGPRVYGETSPTRPWQAPATPLRPASSPHRPCASGRCNGVGSASAGPGPW